MRHRTRSTSCPHHEHQKKRRLPAPAPASHGSACPSTQLPEIVMIRTASRSLRTLAAVLCFPIIAGAQATQTAPPAPKPVMTAKPAGAPAARPAAASAAATPSTAAGTHVRATAPSAVAAPASATPAAAPMAAKPAAAGPARDARGRFIAKSAAAPTAGSHATCKDGTAWAGAQRSGACARHGGVKAWN